jgi:hypothetical protein
MADAIAQPRVQAESPLSSDSESPSLTISSSSRRKNASEEPNAPWLATSFKLENFSQRTQAELNEELSGYAPVINPVGVGVKEGVAAARAAPLATPRACRR